MDLLRASLDLFGNSKIKKNTIYINGTEATSEQIEQIEAKAKDNLLLDAKLSKKEYIKENKERYINRPIQTSSGLFFGGISAMSQYSELRELGLSLHKKRGDVPSVNGIVSVNLSQMNELLRELRTQNYKGTVKMFHYYDAIDACSTLEELDAIVWEDVRNA